MRETLPLDQESGEDSHNQHLWSSVHFPGNSILCASPFFVHFSALEVFIHPSSALPLSKCSHPIPMAVMCCQYFNTAITQLSPAPSSWGRIRVLWKSLHTEVGKLLPQPRKKAHHAVLYCHCKSLPCRSQTRMEEGCQH